MSNWSESAVMTTSLPKTQTTQGLTPAPDIHVFLSQKIV